MYSLTIFKPVSDYLTHRWSKNRLPHRKNFKPALFFSTGHYEYWINGSRYQLENGHYLFQVNYDNMNYNEIRINLCGTKEYLTNHNLHNEDGPAVILPNGTLEWWFHDVRHRNYELPAIEYPNGDCEYWRNGKRHRLDGPAVVIGNKQYWFHFGEFIKCTV